MKTIMLPVAPFRQPKEGQCLAACAGMVLNYLKIPFSYSRLLKLLRVQWFGTAHSNIRYLTRLGVRVIYKQGTLTELHQHLLSNSPCIVFVKTRELPYWKIATDHAVVVVGLDSQYVYVNDPEFEINPIQYKSHEGILIWLGLSMGSFMQYCKSQSPKGIGMRIN